MLSKRNVFIGGDILARTIVPLFLWQNPVLITFLAVMLDLWDGLILRTAIKIERGFYQRLDKILDLYFATIVLFFVWGQPVFFPVFLVFYLWRALGVLILLITKRERLLLFFPSVIEFLFFLYIACYWSKSYCPLLNPPAFYYFTALATGAKTVQEYFLHRRCVGLNRMILERLGLRRLAKIFNPPPRKH